MESRKSVRKLADSIRSLLGLKTHLTPSWADSVCNIIKDLPTEEPYTSSQVKCPQFKTLASSENKDDESDSSVTKIQDDLASLNAYLNQLNLQRRQALSDFLDLKGNIRVFCRVRPIIEEEEFRHPKYAVSTDSNNVFLKLSESKSKRYSFDKVFHPDSSQDEVFSEVEPVIKSALDGYNACIFAYGQTGTGKTFTMEGTPDFPGVVPRAIEALFEQAMDSNHTFFFTFSMLEIYMGHLRDLLVPHRMKPTDPMTQSLSIQTDPKGGIEIENLVTIRVSDFNQAKRLYALGSRFRSTASTNSNATSSRSHCLTRISLTSFDAPERRKETNKIWMVDLGGSERVLKTKAWGRRFEEGKSINLSLSALGDVISALQRRKSHVPYRNSKLTQVLRDSLGEESRTLMLVHVSPKEEDLCETVCSLGFATRVRSIHLGHEESTDVHVRKEIAMGKLLQKVKQIENERQDVREKTKKLKERLELLTRKDPSSDEQLDAQHLSSAMPQGNGKMENESSKDVTPSPKLLLPRFMRPTICSRRKFGIDYTSKDHALKKSRNPSRRRTSSVRAESVTFPLKDTSENGSECSISKNSCLTDYGTEYSHNTSECDIKMVVLPEQEKMESHSSHAKSQLILKHFLECGNKKEVVVDSSKCLTVDDWLCIQKSGPINTCAHGSKRVLSIPLPEKKNNSSRPSKADTLHHEEICSLDFTKTNHAGVEKQTDLVRGGGSIMEVVTNPVVLDGYSKINDFALNPTSPYERVMEERLGFSDCSVNEDDTCCPISPANMVTQQVLITDETQFSRETITGQDAEHNINLNEEFHDPILECELESVSQNWRTEVYDRIMVGSERIVVIDQDVETGDLAADKSMAKEHAEGAIRPCLYNMKSRRALSMDLKEVDQDHSIPSVEFDKKTSNPGMCDLLDQKVQKICGAALLGLGFQNLGLEQEFFCALML